MTCALSVADQGCEVFLVEKEAEVDGVPRHLDMLVPTGSNPDEIINRYLKGVESNKNIQLHSGATVKSIDGYLGNFDITVAAGNREEPFIVGTIVVATGAEEFKPERLYGYGELENVITLTQLEIMLKEASFPN
ncbi:MAG: hypothetical protein JXA49_07800 [Actinobacteria bacterium]|nr:hypothetical protein [Actinomycetota bacterium]